MKYAKRIAALLVLAIILVNLVACSGAKSSVKFEQWNDCTALTELKNYVASVTDKNSKDYIPRSRINCTRLLKYRFSLAKRYRKQYKN